MTFSRSGCSLIRFRHFIPIESRQANVRLHQVRSVIEGSCRRHRGVIEASLAVRTIFPNTIRNIAKLLRGVVWILLSLNVRRVSAVFLLIFLATPHYIILVQLSVRILSEPDMRC